MAVPSRHLMRHQNMSLTFRISSRSACRNKQSLSFILITETWDTFFFSQDQTLNYGCSRYTFYAESQRESVNFVKSRGACKVKGSDLVSIESNEEWNFLNESINKFPLKGTEYYIGLTKDKDGSWRWISNNSTVNKSYWAPGEPKDRYNERCAIMYKDYHGYYGLFDDVSCTEKRHGYICESEYHVMG